MQIGLFHLIPKRQRVISRKHNHINHPLLSFNHIPVREVTSHKYLGIILYTTCQWSNQIDQLINKVTPKLNVLRSLKFDFDRKTQEIMFFFLLLLDL